MKCITGPSARGLLMALTTGVALTCAGAAFAQPPGGHQGMHGGIDEMIGRMLSHARDQLNLNSSQQVVFDNAVAQSKAAHEAARANRQKVKAALTAELAKPEPDLAGVAALADSIEQQNRTQRHNVRNEWLRLYATFSPDQKAVTRDMLQKRLQRAESFGERMHERMQQHVRPAG